MGYYKKRISQFFGWIPSKYYLQMVYMYKMGKRLNLKNPQTFNEKLQWLKLYDRKPEYTVMVDKIESKKWVANRIGGSHIIPTLGVWNKAEDIDFNSLPNQFVLKTNHDSGGIVICKNKSKLDIKRTREKLNKSLKINFSVVGREWPYKNVPRKIFAEKYMVDESGQELKDYKIFCFNANPEFIQVDFDRFADSGHKRNLYTPDWNLLNFEYGYKSDSSIKIERPDNLEEMLFFASKLSEGQTFLRVDFYSIQGKTYFGELTFFPGSGFERFSQPNKDNEYGNLIDINLIAR